MSDISNLTYRELQEKVSALGIKSVGKKREELIEILKDSPKEPEKLEKKEPEVNKESASKDLPQVQPEKKSTANVAIVMSNNAEVRTYSVTDHGENFEALARQFASKKGYTVILRDLGGMTTCVHCGKKFYPKG